MTLINRKLLLTLNTLLLVTAGTAFADSRPNIIFIYSDDHAFQSISAYGGRLKDVAPTPNIDRIARNGIRFDRATVTNSICSPARAVVLTGKYSHLNGVRDNATTFDGSQNTFPKMLRENGYETAIIGKWHLGSDPTGFDHWDVLPGQGLYYNPEFRTKAGIETVPGYVTDITTEKSLRWLDRVRKKDKPFLLMMQHKASHRPWVSDSQHLYFLEDQTIPEPANLFDRYENRASAASKQAMTIANDLRPREDLKIYDPNEKTQREDLKVYGVENDTPWPKWMYGNMSDEQRRLWYAAYKQRNADVTDVVLEGTDLVRWQYQAYLKDYLRTIRSIDDSVGEILNYLIANGLDDNTIVVYSSDQGFYLGEHGWYDKRFMYEESFRTPLLMQWPGRIRPGTSTSVLASNLDIAPTLLALAGVEPDPEMQGLSLRPILENELEYQWRDVLYYRYYEYPGSHLVEPHEGVADKRYKLIHFLISDEWELFDHMSDPHEMNSVYADPEYARVRSRLKRRLDELKVQYGVGPDEPTHILHN